MNKGSQALRSGATIGALILMLVSLASGQERKITLTGSDGPCLTAKPRCTDRAL